MLRFLFIFKYFLHWLKAKSHKSFPVGLAGEISRIVLDDEIRFYFFDRAENLRHELLSDKRIVSVTDFGAGSSIDRSKQRKVADIARHSAKKPSLGRMLFRLVNFMQPKNMLELGTSLGLSACYQGAPVPNSRFITLEGCPATADIAKENLLKLNISHINIVVGKFEDTLPQVLAGFTNLDYCFVDGNHTFAATMDYFNRLLPFANEHSVFVFDDIHWSQSMEDAWKMICEHPQVTLCVDIFFVGMVFFRKSEKKQVICIRY